LFRRALAREEEGLMVARPAAPRALSAEAGEFVQFCYSRRRVGWPELYDEMCAVAARGLFRGWGPDELAEHGVGFGLFEMPRLATFVADIIARDRARSRDAGLPATAATPPA
jgi:hypothetical protein